MPIETYSHYYNLGNTIPDGATTYPGATSGTTRVRDDGAALPGGTTSVGDGLDFDADNDGSFDDGGTLWGLTATGDPIIAFSSPFLTGGTTEYWVLSNSSSLTGNVGPVNSGTYTYCFAPGTLIRAAIGEIQVEELKIGDQIETTDGQLVSVKWVGRQALYKKLHGSAMQLVRFKIGALGNGLPSRELTVTADHGLVIDGLIIQASALVNRTSIDFVPLHELPDLFTVYHVETEDHNVIFANGTPSETFVDAASRRQFDNFSEYLDCYDVERVIPEMCKRRISCSRLVPKEIKKRLGIQEDDVEATFR
ncbi:Hint domain-containing protein [Tropicibacter sp. R15_0]|uniref:Hint domain-containing protein n=1 Tax=Tropicibacter sp. R15_0 TaxID=2821101 RepID=UPI001ADCD9B2|nr:Hint domain-containing protein [Tropicibacter sp. R15_0]MBO9464801.1 Hint domain-containing protein [Tropicibacter sp. R15_0]